MLMMPCHDLHAWMNKLITIKTCLGAKNHSATLGQVPVWAIHEFTGKEGEVK